ncbi:MAG: hypothetical protein ACJ76F_03145 [Bacteroidia bacterium]
MRRLQIYNVFFCTAFLLFLFSCSRHKEEESREAPVASVFDTKLYPSDLKNIVPADISKKDSIALIKNYIDKWIQEELVLRYAEKNLGEEQKNIEKQIEAYRKNLLTYTYETELVRQQLDTVVSAGEIENYYNAHISSFQLRDNIVKVCYVKVNRKAPNIDKVKKWYTSLNPKDQESLKSYCIQFAENFFIDDNTWLLFDDLSKEVPIEDYSPELFLKNNKSIEVSDSANIYFLSIRGFKIKNSVSPLSFEKDNIRNIIINKRKLKLVDDMKKQVYQNAKENNNFEIYQ